MTKIRLVEKQKLVWAALVKKSHIIFKKCILSLGRSTIGWAIFVDFGFTSRGPITVYDDTAVQRMITVFGYFIKVVAAVGMKKW